MTVLGDQVETSTVCSSTKTISLEMIFLKLNLFTLIGGASSFNYTHFATFTASNRSENCQMNGSSMIIDNLKAKFSSGASHSPSSKSKKPVTRAVQDV